MTKLRAALALAGAVLAAAHGGPAEAANAKSWVANSGSDANDCTLAHPCATFQRAHDQTSQGGEIGVLTPGDYGGTGASRLLIQKSIAISNDGSGEATILADGPVGAFTGPHGIDVQATAGDIVTLRGLVIDGLGTGGVGASFVQGLALHIQNCVIRNFESATGANGIFFAPAGNGQLFVSDTIIYNNGSGSFTGGIFVTNVNGGSPRMVLDRVHLENNVDGLLIVGNFGARGVRVIVRDSVISGNAANGIHAFTQPEEAPAFAVVERSSMVNNRQNGILADGPGATILLDDSTVARNSVGISAVNSGQLISYRNNRINNNVGPDGAPTSFLALN